MFVSSISSKLFICPLSLVHHYNNHRRPSTLFRLTHFSTHISRLNYGFPINSSQRFQSHSVTNNTSQLNSQYIVPPSHPWPEWSQLLESISISGNYFTSNRNNIKDEFVPIESLSMEFIDAACSCLGFAHDTPDILRWLSKDEIKVLINEGAPFLFKDAIETEKRMRSFLQGEVLSEATTVDLMKYILSYASNPIIHPERNIKEVSESSARNLLSEMAIFIGREKTSAMRAIEKVNVAEEDEQPPRNLGLDVTLKRGDWLCRKCNFMNFAKNTKCLECEELRPKRRLTGSEWDCPQCNFFNNGRNVVCLKCERRRLGEVPLPIGQIKPPAISSRSDLGYAPFVPLPADMFAKKSEYNKTIENNNKATVTESKSENSATKIENQQKDTVEKELNDVTDLSTAISDEDFPEFMPIRNGENRFVVSKKKDRSLTLPTYKKQAMDQGSNKSNFVPFVPFPPDYFAKKHNSQHSNTTDSSRVSDENPTKEPQNTQTDPSEIISENRSVRNGTEEKIQVVSATDDMNLVQETRATQVSKNVDKPETSNGLRNGSSLEGSAVKETDPLDMSEEAKAERWFRRVAQIKDISELSQIPDEDFPSIMPMRKGVNRFVVSKRKTPLERRLTSQQYRRNLRSGSSEPTKGGGS
ncbi:zinc finger protein VAR3, chloroplastic-like [Rutidosis leptorrhynchoides]|uniref:zinc finger protein VAR3, chloroplastic-like n=1 Tax=Rutidosis leptorrhynchoides TaxID=125765 RepID=UPI003A98DC6A